MSEPATPGELLRHLEDELGYDARDLRRIVYGTDEPCMACKSLGRIAECPTCHGTGRIKTPGLVERVTTHDGFYSCCDDDHCIEVRALIRREIGEAP